MIREALTLERLLAMEPSEAAALLVARRREGLTGSEEALLARWLEADEGNQAALDRAEAGWAWLEGGEEHELIAAMRAHALSPAKRGWAAWRAPAAAAAAAALLMVLAAGLFFFLRPGGPGPGPEGAAIHYASGRGEVRVVTLPDGSEMTLDSESSAIGRFDGPERRLQLVRGRALFAVARNPGRRFTVTAEERRIVAVGTRFDVSLLGDGLTVSLLQGRVTVGPLDSTVEPVTLRPGQQFVERDGHAVVRTIGEGVENASSWTRSLLHFDNETLAAAAEQINLYSSERILIRDPQVAAMRISGQFRAGDAMRFATTVAELRPVRAVRRDGTVELVAAR